MKSTMLTYEQIKDYFELRITYKPGWKFKVARPYYDRITTIFEPRDIEIRLVGLVQDALAKDPLTMPLVRINGMQVFTIELLRHEDMCKQVARDLITGLEMHEMNEFFKIDNEYVNDPHPEMRGYAKPITLDSKQLSR